MCSWGHLDLLNTIALLPNGTGECIVDYPIQEGYVDRDYLAPVQQSLTRSQIEAGEVVLVELDSMSSDNAACWMFARAKGYIVISSARLHPEHWIHAYVRTIDETAIRVEALGAQRRVTFEGRWIGSDVVLCDAVALMLDEERVDLDE